MQSQKIGESATLGREECFLDLNIGRTFLPEGGCKICANLQKGAWQARYYAIPGGAR